MWNGLEEMSVTYREGKKEEDREKGGGKSEVRWEYRKERGR